MGRPGRDHRGLPCEPGCRLCQDVALLAQLPVLTPQTRQFLALSAGRAVLSAAFIAIGLTNPVPDRLGGRLELTRQLLRGSPTSDQINHLSPEFRRIGSVTLRHRWHLLLKWKGVHRTGSTPNRRYRHRGIVNEVERAKNRTKSKVRARVEHAIGVIKRVFGFAKVRYRGLKKNTHRLLVTCALANLFMLRRHLLRCQGE